MEFDHYTPLETLHQSRRTGVRRALRASDRRPVILKINTDPDVEDGDRRLEHEHDIGRMLNGEFAAVPLSLETADGPATLVFDDDGMTALSRLIPPDGFGPDAFLPLAVGIVKAVESVHARNIIHKDINPANLIVTPSLDRVKLIDFELATRMRREEVGIQSAAVLEGTLAYLSPEGTGRVNRAVDYRADFYALGVTLYQLLTGRLPFPESDPMTLVHRHIAKRPPPARKTNPAAPRIVSDLIEKLMNKLAEDRYQSAAGLRADLEECARRYRDAGRIPPFDLARHDVSGRIQIPQKLYGRESEIGRLFDIFGRVANGASEIVFISGYAGVGKTSLVREVHKPMTEKNGLFAPGKFNPFQKDIPYFAVTQAFNEVCRYFLTEPPAVLERRRSRIMAALGPNSQIVADVVPELENVIGPRPAPPAMGAAEAQHRFDIYVKRFVRALCRPDQPLILFIDDLQWGDRASMNLLKGLLLDGGIPHLMIIAAYRDNEVDDRHPLMKMRAALETADAGCGGIHIEALTRAGINALLADSLALPPTDTEPLAGLIFEKTGGNAFFTHQFIHELAEDGRLYFDAQRRRWRWRADRIVEHRVAATVVDMMADRMGRLDPATLAALRAAACIGGRFGLDLLSRTLGKDLETTLAALDPALTGGLILPLTDDYKHADTRHAARFKFLHDRVHQAAYSLTDPRDRRRTHLKIGRLLRRDALDDPLAAAVLDIAEQYRHAIDLVEDPAEKNELARLYLMAGRKAKAAAAYREALAYLTTGQGCLSPGRADAPTDLAFPLFEEAAEAAFLCGEYAAMDRHADAALDRARSLADEARIRIIQIQALIARNRRKDGIAKALAFLDKLGIELPESPAPEAVGGALADMAAFLSDRSIESFVDLPAMTDETLIPAVRIMAAATSAAFVAAPGLMVLLILKQVELSIRHGNLPESSYFYVFYGVVLCGVVMDTDTGYRFGRLAVALQDRTPDRRTAAKTGHVFNDLVRPWKEHLRSSLTPLIENYEIGLELGDVEFAAYSAHIYSAYLFLAGEPLDAVEAEIARYSRAIEAIHQTDTHCWNLIFWQTVLNLTGASPAPWEITGRVHDETARLPVYTGANDKMALCYLFLNKCILNYLFEDYPAAIGNAERVEPHLDGATGKYTVAVFYFYDALARLAHYAAMPADEQDAAMERVVEDQRKLASWAGFAPMNFQHKHDLVAAEKARVLGQLEAIPLYEAAISGAKQHGFLQEEAFGYELAARCYLGRNMQKAARTYLAEALALYGKWGARAKCDQLRRTYPKFLLSDPFRPDGSATLTETQLDRQSIVKVSQAISSEVRLDRLLEKLIAIAVENAGADRGALIVCEDEGPKLQAIQTVDPEATRTLMGTPIEASADIPAAMIRRVIRSGEIVALPDASADPSWRENVYIERTRPKSVLCMPIIYRGEATGVLYLENSRFADIFTEERVRTLDILAAQAAISIQNARLFGTLQESRDHAADLIDKSPGLICGIDPDGRATFVNPTVERITGYNSEEMVGRDLLALLYPGDEQHQIKSFFDRPETGEVTGCEMTLTCKNGEKRTVEWSSLTRRDDGGRIKEIIGFGNDITGRKRADKALRESENRLKSILQANPSPVVVYDAQGHPRFMNPGFTEVFGWTMDELRGRTIPFVPEAEKAKTAEEIKKIYRTGRPAKFATRRLTKGGDELDVIVSAAIIKRSDDAHSGMVVNLTDISEQKRLERQLNQAQKMESVGRLAGGVAHDFNNMLTIILGNTEMIMEDLGPDHPLHADIEAIQNAAQRSTDLVRQLLAFARKQTIAPERLDLNAAVEGMLKMLQRLIGENIALDWRPAMDLWPIHIDPSQIDQALANLCVNARDAIDGVGRVVIETRNVSFDAADCRLRPELKPGDYVMMVFSDNGCGMDRETVRNIFEPFFTTKKVGQGTGLGLATIYGIVKQNDGFINVYSEPGRGTTFKLYFPRHRPTAEGTKTVARTTPADTGHETILIVEDEKYILEMAGMMLDRLGYRVATAESPGEAVRMVENGGVGPIDLLLTDVVMPGMNGRELCDTLLRVYPTLKCLFMSGYTADVIARHGVLEEGVAFINKPFSIRDLGAKVREVLDG